MINAATYIHEYWVSDVEVNYLAGVGENNEDHGLGRIWRATASYLPAFLGDTRSPHKTSTVDFHLRGLHQRLAPEAAYAMLLPI